MLPPPTTMPTWTPRRVDLARPGAAMNAQNAGIDAVRPVAEERLAGQLQQDPPVADRRLRGRGSLVGRPSLTAPPRARSG